MHFGVISHLLDDGIAVHGLGYACDGLPTLPVGEKAIIGGVQTRDVDGLLPLPIEENAKSWINFRAPRNCSRWTFPPACGGKVCLSAACGRLSPLPVEEKAISWTWCAFAMAFIPCLSKKNPFQGTPASPREAPKGPQKWPGSSRAKKKQFLF